MNYVGTIGYRTGTLGAQIYEGFAASFIGALQFLYHDKCDRSGEIYFDRGMSCMPFQAANDLAAGFKGNWLLMLDTDHVFESDAFANMIDVFTTHDLDVLVGFTQKRQPPYDPVIYRYDFDPENSLDPIFPEFINRYELLPIDCSGCACLMVSRRAFEKIATIFASRPFDLIPKFHEKDISEDCKKAGMRQTDTFWEDVSFFQRVRMAGLRAYCAPWIKFYHLETRLVSEDLIRRTKEEEAIPR